MPTKSTAEAFNVSSALLGAFSTNDRINAYLIEIWPTKHGMRNPPQAKGGRSPRS